MTEKENKAYAAGMVDGEGCVTVVRTTRRKEGKVYHSLRPMIIVVNTEPGLLRPIIDLCGCYDIQCNLYTLTHPSRLELFRLVVEGFEACSRFIPLVLDHLQGRKQDRAARMLEWCTYRLRYVYRPQTKRDYELAGPLFASNRSMDRVAVIDSVIEEMLSRRVDPNQLSLIYTERG